MSNKLLLLYRKFNCFIFPFKDGKNESIWSEVPKENLLIQVKIILIAKPKPNTNSNTEIPMAKWSKASG